MASRMGLPDFPGGWVVTLMPGKIEGRRRRGRQRMRWLDASPTQWTWVWVDCGSWWWTGRLGVLWFKGSQRVGHDWATELNWTEWLRNHLAMQGTRVGPKARSHMSQSCEACAPPLLKPMVPRACVPPQEKPPQWEACTATKSSPSLRQLKKAERSNKDPVQSKIKQILWKRMGLPVTVSVYNSLPLTVLILSLRGSPGQMSFCLWFLQNKSRYQSESESRSVVYDSLLLHGL